MEFIFERRWYGRGICYTWAFVKNSVGEFISTGDPWPSRQWPKKELIAAGSYTLRYDHTYFEGIDLNMFTLGPRIELPVGFAYDQKGFVYKI